MLRYVLKYTGKFFEPEQYRNIVAVLLEAVSTANTLFAAGYASYLEVVTAQRRVLEAELELIDTRQAQFLSLIDLYRSLGGGWQ